MIRHDAPRATAQFSPLERHTMAAEALGKILGDRKPSTTPKVVLLDTEARRLRVVSTTAANAGQYLRKPMCLGTYDAHITVADLISDFNTVYPDSAQCGALS